jgi:VanZ family protein
MVKRIPAFSKILLATSIAAVVYFSASPPPCQFPLRWDGPNDKLGHLSAYWLLTLATVFTLRSYLPLTTTLLASSLATFGLGLLMEVLQCFIPSRSGLELADILVNAFGVLSGASTSLLLLITARAYKSRPRPASE